MPIQDYTHVCYILDRSGSMADVVKDVLGGYQTFVEEQKAAPGTCTMSLHQFDTEFREDYSFVPVANVMALRFQPRGSTALLDAVGMAVTREQEKIEKLAEDQRPALVIVVIHTDGEENASREWTFEKVKEMIQALEASTAPLWKFTFLGAGLEVAKQAVHLGVSQGSTGGYTSTKGGIVNTSRRIARARGTLSRGGSASDASAQADYTDQDRDDIT